MLGEEGIFEGTLSHSRRFDIRHLFKYRLWMVLARISGSRLPWLIQPRWRRYLTAEEVVEQASLSAHDDVYVLTQPSLFGRSFNPVSFYFVVCNGDVQGIVAHVHNTPWNERHTYALKKTHMERGAIVWSFDKAFHVSPFLPMDLTYTWRFLLEADRILVTSQACDRGEQVFSAALNLTRSDMARGAPVWLRIRYPVQNLTTLWRIYWQALILKTKGAVFYAHPNR